MKINKLVLGGVAAVLVAAFWLGAVLYQRDQPAPVAVTPEPSADVQLVRPYSPTLGPANAAVTVVEFFDPECEACRAMYPIVKQVLSEFDGRVRLVIRYMPLHGNSVYAATLLEGARAQNRYWEFLEVVMFRQPEWASHHAPRPDLLMTYVSQAGVDAGLLRAAAEQPETQERIRQDQADGMALGANQTPTFFINGKPLMELGYPQLRAAIEAELR